MTLSGCMGHLGFTTRLTIVQANLAFTVMQDSIGTARLFSIEGKQAQPPGISFKWNSRALCGQVGGRI